MTTHSTTPTEAGDDSHDHTHDHYHLRPGVSDDSSDHSLPLVSASRHTHDRSHVSRVAASGQRLPAGSSDLTRLERVRRADVFDPLSRLRRTQAAGYVNRLVESPLECEGGSPVRESGMSAGEWGTVRELSHVITRLVPGCVSFRNNGSAVGCRSSVLVSVSLGGSAPICAIESLGLSGRGGQDDPCPEGCVLGLEVSEAFSQQLELFLPASPGRSQAVQFRNDPIEPALCRLVSSALGL